MKITVFIENNKNELYIDDRIQIPTTAEMITKNVVVYRKYKNVIAGENDHVVYGSKKITFGEGYWTFEKIKKKFKEDNITVAENRYNNTCSIFSDRDLNFKNFAPLGFPTDHVVRDSTPKISPNVVDVNQGLKYINISCDIVNSIGNINTNGSKCYI